MPAELAFDINLAAIIPEIIITIMACAILLVDVFFQKDDESFNYAQNMSLATLAVVGFFIVYGMRGESLLTFSGMFARDGLAGFSKLIFVVSSFFVILIADKNLRMEKVNQGEFYVFLLFATLGEMVLVSAADLMMIYLGMELMSLSIYCLAGFSRRDKRSNEAAIKYFLLGLVSSGIMLYGMSLIYGITGATRLDMIAEFFVQGGKYSEPLLIFATVMTVSGFAFKVAAAPFHMWAPDVYEGSPTSVAAFMSIGPKAAGFASLARLLLIALPAVRVNWMVILAVLAVLTMTVGNLAALMQKSLKRMLAYSSISHAGYMLVGLAAMAGEYQNMGHASSGHPAYGLYAVLFYGFTYIFMNIGAFGMIIYIGRAGRGGEMISDFNGLSKTNPGMATAMMIFMFALAGVPPAVGFVGKLYIFTAAINAGLMWLALIGVVNSAVSVYYYLQVLVAMYYREPEGEIPTNDDPKISWAIGVSAVLSLLLGVYPGPLLELARHSVEGLIK